MHRSTDRILTTHTGSLPRPEALTQLYVKRSRGEPVDAAEIERLGREAVRESVARQRTSGIDIGNNGEQQRDSFFLYLRQRLSGLGGTWTRPTRGDVDRYPEFQKLWARQYGGTVGVSNLMGIPKTIGEIRYLDDTAIEDECRHFKAVLDGAPDRFVEPFMCAPSPGIVALACKNEHYDTLDNHLAALGRALKVEYDAIARHGFLLQIDAPDLALERHITYKDQPVSAFQDFVDKTIATINAALVDVPRDRVRLHVCWGNSESPHDRDVPLEDILPVLMKANVGAFVLPFANPRHAHEFKLFAKMPLADDQILVAGVIDSLTNFVEHPETVADRIERVARVVGDPSRVQAGTDCGFDTFIRFSQVDPDVVWLKLQALSEGAEIASDELWAKSAA
jgi:5-methyltetrahydropteroyltriglutamate--homocysteine methyltransferase